MTIYASMAAYFIIGSLILLLLVVYCDGYEWAPYTFLTLLPIIVIWLGIFYAISDKKGRLC